MTLKLEEQIIGAITFVPGLVGLSILDFSKKATILNEKDWIQGILIDKSSKGLVVRVATIISNDVRAKVVCEEVSASVKDVLKKNKQKLEKVLVYIRGVK